VRALLVVLLLGGCTDVVELLPPDSAPAVDARAIDARPAIDAPPLADAAIDAVATLCRCRITTCPSTPCDDLLDGTCAADRWCAGDLGPCLDDSACVALGGDFCAAAGDSIDPCP
jgi:hypothetical protein